MSFRYPATTTINTDLQRPHVPTSLSMMAGCWYKVHSVGSVSEYPFLFGWKDTNTYDIMSVRWAENYGPYWQQNWDTNYYSKVFYIDNTVPPLETWMYTTFRVSSTYVRISNIIEDGSFNHESLGSLPSNEMTPIDSCWVDIPSSNDSSMSVAEYWVASPDPFSYLGNNNMPEPIVRHMAYHSPWSIPQVAGKIIYYNSFRQGLYTSAPGDYWINKVISGGSIGSTLTTSFVGDNPPLSANYVRPYNLAPPPLIV
jgi:hypothetical protein